MRDNKKNNLTNVFACITALLGGAAAMASSNTIQTGACCYENADNLLVCDVLTEHVCTDYNGYYYGDGTDCTDPFVECDPIQTEGACCVPQADGTLACLVLVASDCAGSNGYYYGDGTTCSDPFVECDPLNADGACCVPQADGTLACFVLTASDCAGSNGYYYGDGTTCSDPFVECDPLPEEGACCFDKNGTLTCAEITDQKCQDVGGLWYGPGVLCTDPQVDCVQPDPEGACCYEDADTGLLVCNEMIQEWCIDLGGVWYGPGTICTDPQVECFQPDPEGACCYEDADTGLLVCNEMIQEWCIDLGGIWYGPGTICTDPQVECFDPIEDCDLHAPSNCAGRPHYSDPDFADVFLGGRVAVETSSPSILGGQVVKVFDITNINSAPNDTWFAMNRYSDPDWSPQNLGSIFGLAVDGDGNIYVTATRSWNADYAAFGGWGAVYRLDHITGDITLFASLPNQGSSLGNIAYDCDHDQFFVSNIEDGLVYRLDANGNILDTFDHGTPWGGGAGPAALGDRVWAVEVHGGRLYYSIWNEDRLNKSATKENEIWSVELDGLGQPMGLERLEVTVPGYASNSGPEYSSPVSDMRFTIEGSMLVAERSMNGWDTISAHDSRALEFECINGIWTCDVNRFQVGFGSGRNSSGGIDATRELVFASGDALHLGFGDNIYGWQALPMPGGDITNSKLVDYQDNLNSQDKTLIGDLAITDIDYCVPVMSNYVDCVMSAGGGTHHEMGFYMSTGLQTIAALEFTAPAGVSLSPSYFAGPFNPMTSYPMSTSVFGAASGQQCFEVTVYYQNGTSCTSELCIEFPECEDPCPGDVNGDGTIDIGDLLSVIAQWGQSCTGCPNDIDGNGTVGIGDLLAIISYWGDPC
ncbi:MAG: hypothetical protein CMJ24_00050 [Phycisphaerae bacterium]|nr:hypothetical protein [Phycisphaerae bacterium]